MNAIHKFNYRLGTISQALNWRTTSGKVVSYEPYIREMRVWANLFKHIDIFAPLSTDEIRVTVSEYGFSNVSFDFVSYSHRISFLSSLHRLVQLPLVLIKLLAFIWSHDILLIRSPSHFGLFAHIFVFLLRKKSITKYAGFFSGFEGERMPSIVERNIIEKVIGPPHYALVYGSAKRDHLISFIPAAISKKEVSWLRTLRNGQANKRPVFYALGKLIPVKNFDLVIKSLGLLFHDHAELDWEFHLIGDGVELDMLRHLSDYHNLSGRVYFEGKLSYEESMRKLATADIVIMPGLKEGWPKVVIEGWSAGAVPVVANAGITNEIIQDGISGFIFEPETIHLKNVLFRVLTQPHLIDEIRLTGWKEVEKFTIEKFSQGIEEICSKRLILESST